MQIGMDMQILRYEPPSGLFYHLWSLFDWLARLEGAYGHHLNPFLYGLHGMAEPEPVSRLQGQFPGNRLQYYWDGPPFKLVGSYFAEAPARAPGLVRKIDRNVVFPLWRRWSETVTRHPRMAVHFPSWGKSEMALSQLDLFHHLEVPLFPPRALKRNVMTIPDLTTRRVPEFHCAANVEFADSALSMVPQMDMLITWTEHTKQDVVNVLGIDPDRVRVTPLAAQEAYRFIEDRAEVEEVLARYGLAGRPYAMTLGTLEPRKNHCRLIEAFHLLKQEAPAIEHRLILVGGKGWKYEPIFELIERLGLGSQVCWLGYVPFRDIPALLNGADVFIYPSLYEGFGLPPLEAMACGAPVIASNVTSLPEVVGEAGLLVDPTRVEDIAAALHRLITDRTLNAELRQKGRERARLFTCENTARRTYAVYEELAQRSDVRASGRRACPMLPTKLREHLRSWIVGQLMIANGL